jgi:hypothetical protein
MAKQIVINTPALQKLLAQYTDMDTEAQNVLGPSTWQGPGGPVNADLSAALPLRIGSTNWEAAQTLATTVNTGLRGAINDRLKAYGTNINSLHYGIAYLIEGSDKTESLNKLKAGDFNGALPQTKT